jgi:hypothetical protein
MGDNALGGKEFTAFAELPLLCVGKLDGSDGEYAGN